jgi:hypothetical protein
MADYQRVIEFLRDVRQGTGSAGLQTVTEEIRSMAAEYASLCAVANERLRKCSAFLQQGLRTEAIHLAEESPNLLDLVSQLDLPDPQVWADYCEANSLPIPPALQLDRAAQLNEAYSQDQPLEHLLARHRFLALSRAPVRERLDVMRQLAQIDAGNPNWEKDIRIFEHARLKELPSAFYNAVKNHDHVAIAALKAELTEQQWFDSPPADLIQSVNDAFGRVQRAGVETELRKLVEPLREAFAARSLQECQALVQRWKNTMANAGITQVCAELMDEIKPVVAFITEQTKRDEFLRRFHESCKAFAKMLDADLDDSQLEAGYAKLKEFHEPIPEDLTARYLAKRSGRRQSADRRHKQRLLLTGGVFALLIIIGLAAVLVSLRSSNTAKWAKSINDAVAKNSLDGLQRAHKTVADLNASHRDLLKEPGIAQAIVNLDAAQARFDADAANIKVAAAKLETAQKTAAGVAARTNSSADETRAAAAALDTAINQATDLLNNAAWADPEGKLRNVVTDAQTLRKTLQERIAADVGKELQAIHAALNAIPAAPTTPIAVSQAQAQLASLADRAAKIAELPLDENTKTDVTALVDQIAKRRQDTSASSGVAEGLEAVRKSVTGIADIRQALKNFAARFPADPRTADFNAALQRFAGVEMLDAWQTKLASYQGRFNPSGATDAQKRIDDLTAFLAAHPELPKADQGNQYVEYLKRAIDTLSDKGPWQTSLDPLLTNRLLKDLTYLDISDGRRFYALGDPGRTEHRMNTVVSVSFDTINLKPDADGKIDYTKSVKITIDPPLKVSEAVQLAPHAKFVADLTDSLKTLNDANWDTFGIDVADKLARHDQMDVVVKAILLQQVLKTQLAVTGGMMGDIYDRTLDALARQKPDELPWPDPTKITEGTRQAIKATIAEMPKADAAKQRLAAARTALFTSLTLNVIGPGMVMKDDAGAWVLYTRAAPETKAQVWAIVPASTTPPAPPAATPATGSAPAPAITQPPMNLVLVGTAADARFVLDNAALGNVPQGSIVLITRP